MMHPMNRESEKNSITALSLILVLLAACVPVWVAHMGPVYTFIPPVVVVAWSVIPYAYPMRNVARVLWCASGLQTVLTAVYWATL
jgi:hypothetical protein